MNRNEHIKVEFSPSERDIGMECPRCKQPTLFHRVRIGEIQLLSYCQNCGVLADCYVQEDLSVVAGIWTHPVIGYTPEEKKREDKRKVSDVRRHTFKCIYFRQKGLDIPDEPHTYEQKDQISCMIQDYIKQHPEEKATIIKECLAIFEKEDCEM